MDTEELALRRISESRQFMEHALKIADGDPSVYVSEIRRWALLLTGHLQDLHDSLRALSEQNRAYREALQTILAQEHTWEMKDTARRALEEAAE